MSASNRKKLIIGIVSGVVILIILGVVLGIVLNKKHECNSCDCNPNLCVPVCNSCECDSSLCDPPENEETEEDDLSENTVNEGNETDDEEKDIVVDINYKLNEVSVYDDSTTKTSSVTVNNGSSRRRLEQQNYQTTINGKYLLNVYKIDVSDENKIYYAYAILLELSKKTGKNEEKMGGSDVRNPDNSDFPFIKFSFDSKGNILKFEVAENYDKVLISYIYEFIEKVVPHLDKKLYGRKLEGEPSFDSEKKGGKTNLIRKDNEIFDGFDGSKHERNIQATVEKNKVKTVKTTSKSTFNQGNSFDIDNENNFKEETAGNNLVTINVPIQSFTESLESSLSLSSSEENEELTNKINDIVNSKNLEEYKKESERRILNLIDKNSKLSTKNQLRNLDDIITEPFRQPFIFTFPLFNIDLLGAQIGLFANVSFVPILGKFELEIFYNKNGEYESVGHKSIETNFDEIINVIDEVIDQLRVLIEGNIALEIKGIYETYQKDIDKHLNELFEGIGTVPDLSDVFQTPLKTLYETIRTASFNCYNAALDKTNEVINIIFPEIQMNIDSGNEEYVNNILSLTEEDVKKFLSDNKNNTYSLYQAAKVFYPGVLNAIETRLEILRQNYKEDEFDFDITTFYDIQDIYKKVITLMSGFEKSIKDAILRENLTFYNNVNDKFEEILNDPLKNVEIISYNARNNASVIDAIINVHSNGEGKRQELINGINSLRVKINDMLTSIYDKIYNVYYDNLFNTNDFKEINDNLEQYMKEIETNQTSLIDYIRTNFLKYELNFEIYIEDVKVLLEVNKKAAESRESNYNNIYKTISGIVDTYLTEEKLDGINKELNELLSNIIISTQKRQYSYALGNITSLKNKVQDIINNTLSDKVYNAVVSRYTDTTLLRNMIKNYYSNVYNAYLEFNSTFFTNTFLKHVNQYVSKPQEIITKFNRILKSQEKEKESQVENINDLIVNSINGAIESSYYTIFKLIEELELEFRTKAPKNIYGEYGTYQAKWEEVDNKLIDLLNLFFDNNGNMNVTHKYKRSKQDEFNLTSIIDEEEEKIYLMLYTISDELENSVQKYICKGNNLVCENGELIGLVTPLDQYNYQMAKLRNSISQLKDLISIAESVTDGTLSQLNSENYFNLYSKQKYLSFHIAADFKRYLGEIRIETDKQMLPFVEKIKRDITNSYEENINLKGIEEAIKNMALKIFVDPSSLQNELNKYMKAIYGTKNKIIELFKKEIDYYNFGDYILDIQGYNQSYNNLRKEIDDYFNEQKENLFKDLELSKDLKLKILTELYNIIDFGYENLKGVVESINFDFQFLDHNYNSKTIFEEALNEKREQLKNYAFNLVNNIYAEYLKLFKETLIQTMKEKYEDAINWLDHQYNSTYIEFQKKNGNVKISSISVYNHLKQVFVDYISKVKEIYNKNSLMEEIENIQNKEIGEGINIEIEFNSIVSNITGDITTFLEEAEKRLIDEKLEFLSNIDSGFVAGFNKTVLDFLKSDGINEMKTLWENDYKATIGFKFRELTEEIGYIKDFMLVIMESSDSKLISKRLAEELKVIYSQFNDEINEIIPLQIDNVIYPKILSFENEILKLIPESFINTLKRELESSDLKNTMKNEKLLDLVPKIFPEGFKANLTSYLKEMLDLKSLNDLKDSYSSQIYSDLDTLSKLVMEYHNLIRNTVGGKAQGQTSPDVTTVVSKYNEYAKVINEYNDIFTFEVDQEKKISNIENFLKNRLLNHIKGIRNGFDLQVSIGEDGVNDAMNNYNQEDVLQQVKNLLNNNIGQKVTSVNNSLVAEMNLLRWEIGNIFDTKMRDLLVDACKDLSVTGFIKTSENRRRNLKEYNLNQVNEYITFIYNNYKQFNHSILTNDNFVKIRTKEGSFYNKLVEAMFHLDDYFYRYEYLIKEYTALGTFTDNYKIQSSQVKNYINQFLINQATKIDDTVNSITNNVKNGWNRIKGVINQSIKDALDNEFKILLGNLKSLNENNQLVNSIVESIKPINLYNKNQELMFTINLETVANNMKYGYSITPVKDENLYNFDVNVYTTGSLNVIISTSISDFYVGKLSGVLGSGKIGINPYYNISDKSVKIDAYAKYDKSKYISLWQKFNLELMKLEIDVQAEIDIPEKEEFSITKYYKHFK